MPISFNFLSCSDSNEIDSTIGKIVIKPDDPNEESINATIISSDSVSYTHLTLPTSDLV